LRRQRNPQRKSYAILIARSRTKEEFWVQGEIDTRGA
jgi:hypothetical protein